MVENAKFALLIVDMLNDFFLGHSELMAQRSSLVASVNQLARAFRQSKQAVIWIRQEFAPDLSDAFLEMRKHNVRVTIAGTAGADILPELERDPSDGITFMTCGLTIWRWSRPLRNAAAQAPVVMRTQPPA